MLFFHVLFWLLVGNACVETVKHRSVNQPDSSFAGVVKRLAVLEDKERQNDEIIAAFKEEVLNLKQKAMDDHQTILRLNRELKGNKITAMTRERRIAAEHQVAFSATLLPHDVYHLGFNQPIVFDNTVLNVGNGYNSSTGVFSAPYDGIYSFTSTIFGRLDNGTMYFKLCKNIVSCFARFEIKESHQVTQSVILELHKGDDVAVLHHGNDDGIVGHNFTTFSGFLLYERFPQVPVVG